MPDADKDKLPVMVFIHGGAYITGDANLYVPTKLMDQDVMVVVLQYRLSTLGNIIKLCNISQHVKNTS